MKIGILTFQFAINYGAVLQCYALQKTLIEMGHDVEIINFIPPDFKYYLFWQNNEFRKNPFIGFQKAIVKLLYAADQKRKFKEFSSQYLNLSKLHDIESISTISEEYDCIIVGSDQIWNKSQFTHYAYFLAPFVNFKGKRISYAPCCSLNIGEGRNNRILAQLLTSFNHISVRNIETCEFVNEIIRKEPPIVVDPTLLCDYDSLINNIYKKNYDYILTYILGEEIEGGHLETIKKIKENNSDLPVISIILTENKPHIFTWSDKTLWNISPQEWLNLFYNAKFVYTDSFHGVLFAIKFQKPFLAYYNDPNRKSRFIDLIIRYNLGKSIVSSLNDAKNKNSFKDLPIYSNLNVLINENIKISLGFLKNAIS